MILPDRSFGSATLRSQGHRRCIAAHFLAELALRRLVFARDKSAHWLLGLDVNVRTAPLID